MCDIDAVSRTGRRLSGPMTILWLICAAAMLSLDLSAQEPGVDQFDRSSADREMRRANLYWSRGVYDQARRSATRAKNFFLLNDMDVPLGDSLLLLGRIAYSKGEIDRAINLYSQAERIFREVGSPVHLFGVHVSRGILFENSAMPDNLVLALAEYRAAEAILDDNAIDNNDARISLAINVGRVLERSSRLGEAEEMYSQALGLAQTHDQKFVALHNLAVIALIRQQYGGALAHAMEALPYQEHIHSTSFLLGGDNSLAFIDEKSGTYNVAIASLIAQGNIEQAYGMLQQSRLNSFQLQIRARDTVASLPDLQKAWARWGLLETRLSELERRAALVYDVDERRRLLEGKNRLQAELGKIRQETYLDPRVYQAVFGMPEVTLEDVYAALGQAEVAIEYFVYVDGNGRALVPRLAAFVLQSSGLELVELAQGADVSEVFARVARYTDLQGPEQLVRLGGRSSLYSRIESEARSLFDTLIGQLMPSLGEARRLLIVPYSDLNLLPFEALVAPDGDFAVSRYVISYLNSTSELTSDHGAPGTGARIFGDMDYGRAAPGVRGIEAIADSDVVVSRLKSSLKNTPPVTDVTLDDATENRFKSESSGYEVLIIWTHGTYSSYERDGPVPAFAEDSDASKVLIDSPELVYAWDHHWWRQRFHDPLSDSLLYFAGVNSGGDGVDDGYLTAREVLGLDLRGTAITVLAACETGVGQISPTQGVIGLKKAFSVAGTRNLLTSLWKVPAIQTADLLEKVFHNRGELDYATAVQRAKIDVIEELRQSGSLPFPFFWAGFVLVGPGH